MHRLQPHSRLALACVLVATIQSVCALNPTTTKVPFTKTPMFIVLAVCIPIILLFLSAAFGIGFYFYRRYRSTSPEQNGQSGAELGGIQESNTTVTKVKSVAAGTPISSRTSYMEKCKKRAVRRQAKLIKKQSDKAAASPRLKRISAAAVDDEEMSKSDDNAATRHRTMDNQHGQTNDELSAANMVAKEAKEAKADSKPQDQKQKKKLKLDTTQHEEDHTKTKIIEMTAIDDDDKKVESPFGGSTFESKNEKKPDKPHIYMNMDLVSSHTKQQVIDEMRNKPWTRQHFRDLKAARDEQDKLLDKMVEDPSQKKDMPKFERQLNIVKNLDAAIGEMRRQIQEHNKRDAKLKTAEDHPVSEQKKK